MNTQHTDKIFAGSIPEIYEKFLVPLIFEVYAQDLARRVKERPVSRVLEIAAGTGVVTRAIADALDEKVSIVATDLNQAMLDHAFSVRADPNIEWHEADALELPFEDDSFDVVLCQFGVMFFPDRVRAYAETRRVLRAGGRFIFNVWDRIEDNEFADTVTSALRDVFPDDPPLFLPRTPHGYFNLDEIVSELSAAGFTSDPDFETVTARSKALSPSAPAIAYCQGTPLRNEIESRDSSRLQHATEIATAALSKRFGKGAVDGKIQAHAVVVEA